MSYMNRWIIIVLLIVAALVCYSIAGILGLGIFIVLGITFEIFFWRALIGKFTKRNDSKLS